MNQTKKKRLLMISESAIMLALATVLSMIPFLQLPMGGSITIFSMLPVLIIAYRYGMKWGFLVGITYGLIQMVLGLNNLTYATSPWAAICIILFDYLVAFGVLGFGGLFRKLKIQSVGFALGTAVACTLRFLCHFITGVTVWDMYAEDMPVALYSLIYNGSYMLPETAITIVIGVILMLFLNFRSEKLSPLRKSK